ncbi:MAG TPA: DUF917 domain-containing protein [Negativicutes bacterium]|nr:DUF917 domain-containing protein [Negativicutes bacterium]
MAKRIMNEQQIIDVIWGATLLGGGGGGSMKNGMDLLEKYKQDHPSTPLEITVYDYKEMEPDAYAAVTAGMGAPTAIKDVDFSAYATNAFEALQDMAAKMDPPKRLKYSMAVEMGGFNTFVPMMISLVNQIPFIDGDGAGRAVPALDTLLLHVNGCNTSPLAMADCNNNRLTIEMADPRNAGLAEEIGRHICMAFNMLSGLSGWMVKGEDFEKRIVDGSVTLAEKIGHVLRNCAEQGGDVFAILGEKGIVECKKIAEGEVIAAENIMEKGFDYGKVVIEGDDETTIYFQNENLLVNKKGKPLITVPDIICTYDLASGVPLTNADIKKGMKIAVGAIKVNEKWYINPNMFDVWKPFLKRVGYTGGNIPFMK